MLLTAIVGVGALSIDMFLPSLPTIAAVFGADAATAQLTVTLFLAGLAVSQLFWGPLSDRLGRRRVLLTGLALYALAGTACAFVPGIGTLIVARVVQAFGAGSGPVIARAVVRDLYEPQRAARILAAMGTAQALTPILAPIIGGWVHALAGWHAVFLVQGAFGAAFLLTAARVVPETDVYAGAPAAEPLARRLAELVGHPRYVAYVAVAALMFGGQFAFITGSSFTLIGVLGVSPTTYGLCFAAVAVGLMTGNFVSVNIGPRLGIDAMIRAGTFIGATAGLVMAVLAAAGVAALVTFTVLSRAPTASRS
jgi:DHA1 family bicyclomycin/chloramphenicol resistance-like MFS transporter